MGGGGGGSSWARLNPGTGLRNKFGEVYTKERVGDRWIARSPQNGGKEGGVVLVWKKKKSREL